MFDDLPVEPEIYEEAMASPEKEQWIATMREEYQSLGKSYFASSERWAVTFLLNWNFVKWNRPYDHGVELTFENFIDIFFDKKHL